MIVCRNIIFVAALSAFRSWSDERLKDKMMDLASFPSPISAENNNGATFAVQTRLKDSGQSTYPPMITHLVQPFVADDGQPAFSHRVMRRTQGSFEILCVMPLRQKSPTSALHVGHACRMTSA